MNFISNEIAAAAHGLLGLHIYRAPVLLENLERSVVLTDIKVQSRDGGIHENLSQKNKALL
jgi:hypothetical protein